MIRRKLLLTASAVTVFLSLSGPALPIPPPPDPRTNKYFESMRTLDALLGDWQGGFDGMQLKARRQVARGPRGELYLALCDGCRAATGYNELDVLQFDVDANVYELFRPGFQNDRESHLKVQAPHTATLQWDERVGGGNVTNRTTISVQDGVWREAHERVRDDGRTTTLYSITLERAGDAHISIASP